MSTAMCVHVSPRYLCSEKSFAMNLGVVKGENVLGRLFGRG